MAVDTNFGSLFEKLKVEDPWLPPSTWESIPSQNAASRRLRSALPDSSSSSSLASSVSEASLVRLALNALQGVESSLLSIEKISAAFYADPADRTYFGISSVWSRSSSTQALAKILNSIGSFGCLVFLLRKFVDHFTCLNSETVSSGRQHGIGNVVADGKNGYVDHPPYSLVNQAFAVAVGKVIEGYICALDTVCASVGLRRSANSVDPVVHSPEGGTPLTSVVHHEITLLEVYLHTKELRTRIEALGNICNLQNIALSFSSSSFEELGAKASAEFANFHRGGNLLSHLYGQLQVADPGHYTLLKFLFLRSFEPYYSFIRSWIFKAEINDPFKEFMVEYVDSLEPCLYGKVGMPSEIKERDGVSVPCFLEGFLSPIIRAGQQLQVLKKLLEFSTYVGADSHTNDDFLPSWNGNSNSHMFCTTPLTFSKGYLQEMVIARSNYYVNLQEKTEKLLTGLEFRYHQQVAPHTFVPLFLESGDGNGKILDMEGRAGDNTDSDFSNMEENEEFDVLDRSQLSECSSGSDSEEETNADERTRFSNSSVAHEQRYLSVLSFSKCSTINNPLPKPIESEKSLLADNKPLSIFEKTKAIDQMSLFQSETPFGDLSTSSCTWAGRGSYVSGTSHFSTENQWLKRLANESGYSDLNDSSPNCKTNKAFLRGDLPLLADRTCTKNGLIKEALSKDLHVNDNRASEIFSISPRESYCESEFLNGSPNSWTPKSFHLVSKPLDVGSLAYFNFSAVVDPCTLSLEKVDASVRPDSQAQFLSSSIDAPASILRHEKDKHDSEADVILHSDTELPSACSPSNCKEHARDATLPADVRGASSWEKLLGTSCYTGDGISGGHMESLRTVFEIPLDFIVDKCLMQEISLQYKYVSKLVIKLLEEGFDLRVHLQAMRRYFFMESADWADLFLLSIQDHRWSIMEVNQKVPEIQGILELSLQRSSCERDPNKDRLFVYTKGSDSMPSSAIGVNALDFLGLGYRVAWPISIILTPTALKMYAQIFSFLMKVKLAVSSLTDIWCSLKEVIQLMRGNRGSDVHHQEVGPWNMLINLRHKLNHFVSTIQQYVQSQLSHVSWCRFLQSLNYKVKDMIDLELVHMAYLTDSLNICFLSEEARCVAGIIENMLQCALDFKSCITGAMSDIRLDQASLPSKLSKINVSQVMAINRKFESNLKELHLCYLKSPKHGDAGLSCFWGYLNYNDYYSDLNSEMAFLAS
ncbi:Gamma-tubulin complex component 6 [Linum grandiflorum]